MRIFIVSILLPDSWHPQDVVIACNQGIKKLAEVEGKKLTAMDYNSEVIRDYFLRNTRDLEEANEANQVLHSSMRLPAGWRE